MPTKTERVQARTYPGFCDFTLKQCCKDRSRTRSRVPTADRSGAPGNRRCIAASALVTAPSPERRFLVTGRSKKPNKGVQESQIVQRLQLCDHECVCALADRRNKGQTSRLQFRIFPYRTFVKEPHKDRVIKEGNRDDDFRRIPAQ